MYVVRRCWKAVLFALGGVLVAGAGATVVRLLPWLLAPEVPLSVSWPFAQALLIASAEVAFLVGLPAGLAFGLSQGVEAGEIRALFANGSSPLHVALAGLALALPLAVLYGGVSLSLGTDADRPGRFAGQLVAQARASCERAESPQSAVVPLVGVTWLCFGKRPPRLVGPLPKAGQRAWFSAGSLTPSDDLTTVHLTELAIAARDEQGRTLLRVRTREGNIRGLPSWGRSGKLPAPQRMLLVALGTLLAALGATWAVARHSISSRLLALALGALPALALLALLSRLDVHTPLWARAAVVAVPLGAAALAHLCSVLVRVARARP